MYVVVIGGGFIGQLVQYAYPSARVLDWRKTPPEDHLDTRIGPQYLWEPIPGVKSTSFPVYTYVDGRIPTSEGILRYKTKIGKQDDHGDWGLQFQHEMVGWRSELPKPFIEYNTLVRKMYLREHKLDLADGRVIKYDQLISTIPLPALLDLIGPQVGSHMFFKNDPIYMSKKSMIPRYPPDSMVLDYISDPARREYRVTMNGCDEFTEYLTPELGTKKITPGKIHPHENSEKILLALGLQDCLCFGRFGTWRPDELAHQTWMQIAMWAK